jgi:hypothetical protein
MTAYARRVRAEAAMVDKEYAQELSKDVTIHQETGVSASVLRLSMKPAIVWMMTVMAMQMKVLTGTMMEK